MTEYGVQHCKQIANEAIMEAEFRSIIEDKEKTLWGFIGKMHSQQLYPETWLLIKHGIEPQCSGPTIIRLGSGE